MKKKSFVYSLVAMTWPLTLDSCERCVAWQNLSQITWTLQPYSMHIKGMPTDDHHCNFNTQFIKCFTWSRVHMEVQFSVSLSTCYMYHAHIHFSQLRYVLELGPDRQDNWHLFNTRSHKVSGKTSGWAISVLGQQIPVQVYYTANNVSLYFLALFLFGLIFKYRQIRHVKCLWQISFLKDFNIYAKSLLKCMLLTRKLQIYDTI